MAAQCRKVRQLTVDYILFSAFSGCQATPEDSSIAALIEKNLYSTHTTLAGALWGYFRYVVSTF